MYAYIRGVFRGLTLEQQLQNAVKVLNKLARRHKLGIVVQALDKARLLQDQAEFLRRHVTFCLYAQLSVRLLAPMLI